ncbi:MAG: hypothetical protein LUH04_07840, partial [Clostridium sp.]|nr:hypothetical protein [Clostridium sp.]
GYLSPGQLPSYGEVWGGAVLPKNGSARSRISFLGFKECLAGHRIAFTGDAQLFPLRPEPVSGLFIRGVGGIFCFYYSLRWLRKKQQ